MIQNIFATVWQTDHVPCMNPSCDQAIQPSPGTFYIIQGERAAAFCCEVCFREYCGRYLEMTSEESQRRDLLKRMGYRTQG